MFEVHLILKKIVEYLLKICEDSVSIINANHYGKVIHDLSKRRELIDFGSDLVNTSPAPRLSTGYAKIFS